MRDGDVLGLNLGLQVGNVAMVVLLVQYLVMGLVKRLALSLEINASQLITVKANTYYTSSHQIYQLIFLADTHFPKIH